MDRNGNKFARIGAMWDKTSNTTGASYLAGTIKIQDRDIKITIFKNSKKNTPRQPDWTIMTSEDVGNTPYVRTEN